MNSPQGDIHALSGAYAVDALDDLERARFERHLADCEPCRGEVAGLRETAAMLASTTAAVPPAGLRDKVLAGVAATRPMPPATAPAQPTPRRRDRRRAALAAVAAAAVIVVGGGAVAVWQPWNDSPSSQVAGPVEQVLDAPDAERYRQRFEDGSSATVVRSASLGKAVLVAEDMAPPPQGRTYQLWLAQEGGMVPAGLMEQGTGRVMLEGDAGAATAVGITIEPAGGSPAPTSEPIALFSFAGDGAA